MEIKSESLVRMTALDAVPFFRSKTETVGKVIITTSIPLPRNVWLEIFNLLQTKVKEEKEKCGKK